MSLSLSLRLAGRLVVLVGAGAVATRKARTLAEAGARLRIVAPRFADGLRVLLASLPDAEAIERQYRCEDLNEAFLSVIATDDPEVNLRVAEDAQRLGVLAIDATDPMRGDARMLATVRVGDLTFSVDSGSSTPAFSKRIAREIAQRFGIEYDAAARTLAIARSYIKDTLDSNQRALVMRALAEMSIDELAAMDRNRIEDTVEAVAAATLAGDAEPPRTKSAICASRASKLALWQSRHVAAALALHGIATTILTITTAGDRDRSSALAAMGEQAIFVKELESALLAGRAQYAVHSAKDLPSSLPDEMQLAAISKREDPRDAFCSERYASLDALPPGARVGTSSPRRRAQLLALRPDLQCVD
ncbi:MAG TPA: NAD(P)-dependent oxidoreductase, partial [Candidatus Dormibacteraeota bacterium]|nr:NAD(P)-dependent oxidoreductase [Candidatus Dormibacteraeota bacterium]